MTGLHGLHVVVGMAAIAWILRRVDPRRFRQPLFRAGRLRRPLLAPCRYGLDLSVSAVVPHSLGNPRQSRGLRETSYERNASASAIPGDVEHASAVHIVPVSAAVVCGPGLLTHGRHLWLPPGSIWARGACWSRWESPRSRPRWSRCTSCTCVDDTPSTLLVAAGLVFLALPGTDAVRYAANPAGRPAIPHRLPRTISRVGFGLARRRSAGRSSLFGSCPVKPAGAAD